MSLRAIFQAIKDDDKPKNPVPKKDFSKLCRKNGILCNGGTGCEFHDRKQSDVCAYCECLRCVYGMCFPSLTWKGE